MGPILIPLVELVISDLLPPLAAGLGLAVGERLLSKTDVKGAHIIAPPDSGKAPLAKALRKTGVPAMSVGDYITDRMGELARREGFLTISTKNPGGVDPKKVFFMRNLTVDYEDLRAAPPHLKALWEEWERRFYAHQGNSDFFGNELALRTVLGEKGVFNA